MKRSLLLAGLYLLAMQTQLQAQINLNWLTSFVPFWNNGNTNGTANNIGGHSINCTTNVTMHGSGVFMPTMGSYGFPSPSVLGAVFTVPGSSNRIQVTPNFGNNTSYTNIVLSFTAMATNVSFRIVDIDKSDATSSTYFDRVTITGTNGTTTYNPTITKYDATTDPNFLIISGNSARVNSTSGQAGNTDSDASDQRGTVTVNFGSNVINSITIRYDNGPGADSNPASQSIAVGSVSFSQYTLPVTLGNFSGHRQGQDVQLDWTTQQEFNSASFEIERNNGSSSWEKIGTVAAAGNSSAAIDYNFIDRNPQGSLLLYRLKQVDIDNNYKYSGIVRINAHNKANDIQVYPNPFKERVSVSINSPVQQSVSIAVVDPLGRTLKTETRSLFAGANNIMLSQLDELPKAIYHLFIHDENGKLIGRSQLVKE